MRVQLVISLAAVAVTTYAADVTPTTPVAESQTDSLKRSTSTASADDDERIFLSTLIEKATGLFTSSSKKPDKAAELLQLEQEKAAERLKLEQKKGNERANVDNQLDEAYERLNLAGLNPKEKDDVFEKLNFLLWLEEADELAMKYPQTATSAVASLTRQLGPKRVAELIEAAKKVEKTESYAEKLEEAQMNYWLESGNSAIHVFKLLELDKAGDELLTLPLFHHWISYVESFNIKYPREKVSVVEFLKTVKGEEALAKLFDVAVAKTDLKTKNEISDLFALLGLEWAGNGLFSTDPFFKYWRTCLEKFNKAQSHRMSRTSVIESMTTAVGDKRVEEIIQAELEVTSSKEYAKSLRPQQFTGWLRNGKTLEDVFGFLGLNRKDQTLSEKDPLMIRFTKFTKAFNDEHNINLKDTNRDGVQGKVLRGIQFASSTPSGAATTDTEKALFQLWMTKRKHPAEIFELYLTKVDEEDNLFKIPLFATLLKYTDAYRTITQSFELSVVKMIVALSSQNAFGREGSLESVREVCCSTIGGRNVSSLDYPRNAR